jgi:hypothetical protein
VITDKGRFLSKMGKRAGDHQFGWSFAVPDLSIQTIDPTPPRAEPALLEKISQDPDSLAQLPFFVKTDIRRDESHLSTVLESMIGVRP